MHCCKFHLQSQLSKKPHACEGHTCQYGKCYTFRKKAIQILLFISKTRTLIPNLSLSYSLLIPSLSLKLKHHNCHGNILLSFLYQAVLLVLHSLYVVDHLITMFCCWQKLENNGIVPSHNIKTGLEI